MTLKISGYVLREAIRRWQLRSDTASGQFSDSLRKFRDEVKPPPGDIANAFTIAEGAVAALQAVQARYNLAVQIEVAGTRITLLQAIKQLGGAGRIAKMWRTAAGAGKSRDSWQSDAKQAGEERATPTIRHEDALKRADLAAAYAGDLRAAVAKGNAAEIDVKELQLDPKYVEDLLTE